MADTLAKPGQVVDLCLSDRRCPGMVTTTLFNTGNVRAVRIDMPAGREIPEHEAPGEIIVQCLDGRIAFTAMGKTAELEAGQLLYLPPEEPHSVKCVENGSFLLTMLTNG